MKPLKARMHILQKGLDSAMTATMIILAGRQAGRQAGD